MFEKQVLGIFILLCTGVELSYSTSSSYVLVHTNGDSNNLQHDHHYVCGVDTVLICVVTNDNANGLEFAQWVEYSNGHSTQLIGPVHFGSEGTTTIQFELDTGGFYSCQYNKYIQYPKYAFNLTVEVEGTGNTCINLPVSTTTTSSTTSTSTTTTTSSTTTTTSSTTTTTSTTTIHTTSSTNVDVRSTSSINPHFKGLNPLIYTIASALLLGVLTLVSIITCWLRSRKNTHLRTLLPQECPQDYLDYIQEGQFTPLTTSEFIASLRERPPTYNESQNIERQIQDENETTETTPPLNTAPPLPPRNPNSIWTPLEESESSAREPLGNLSFVEGEIDTSSSDERLVNEDHILQHVTLSFLLSESSYQNPPPPPPPNNEEPESQEDEVCNDTETTNLLVGVIPSLDAVV